jgi:phospholipase/lecithinase/hemolysin
VDAFLERSAGAAPGQVLYVIEMGGNDIRDAFQLYATGGNGSAVLAQALVSIAANVQRLYQAGAREFLVWTAPNVGLTPAIRSLGTGAQGLAGLVSQAFNAGLDGTLTQLAIGLPGTSFARLDAFRVLNDIVADPTPINLTTVTTACITPNVAPFSCKDADAFLFWDGIHPTRAGHTILAQETANAVQ